MLKVWYLTPASFRPFLQGLVDDLEREQSSLEGKLDILITTFPT